jgi:hypothetical protein
VNPLVASPSITIVDALAGPTSICQYLPIDFSCNISVSDP